MFRWRKKDPKVAPSTRAARRVERLSTPELGQWLDVGVSTLVSSYGQWSRRGSSIDLQEARGSAEAVYAILEEIHLRDSSTQLR